MALLLAGAAAVAVASVNVARGLAVLREEEAVAREAGTLAPAAAELEEVRRTKAEMRRAHDEYAGWRNSRVALGDPLFNAMKARPNSMRWARLSAKSEFVECAREPGLAYKPRARQCRLIIGGEIQGALSDLVVRSYLETLESSNYLGGAFGKITYPDLTRRQTAAGAPADFKFVIEANTAVRRIEGAAKP